MAVYLNGIIPHNFSSIENKEKAIEELYSILKRLQDYWHFTKGFNIDIIDDEESPLYRIDLPNDLGWLELKNGFIFLNLSYRHFQYFFWEGLRCMVYDIVLALDKDVVYMGCEYSFENCNYGEKDWDSNDFTFNDWLSYKQQIPIYDDNAIFEYNNLPEWIDLFKETFTTCKIRKQKLEERFPNYTILTTSTYGNCFILALDKNGKLVLLNESTSKELRCGKIDGLDNRFNTAGFLIYKGNRCAFYSSEGKKITNYRVREYDWRWEKHNLKDIIVVDCKTKEEIYIKHNK